MPNLTKTSDPERTVVDIDEPVCGACSHPVTAHDRVAARYCAATTSNSHERGCLCSSVPVH